VVLLWRRLDVRGIAVGKIGAGPAIRFSIVAIWALAYKVPVHGAVRGPEWVIDRCVMRFQVRVTRVQSTERSVSATDPEAAMEKIRGELEKPYGFLGSWTTEGHEVQILSVESRVDGIGSSPIGDGPLLLSVRAAADHLGISRATLYDLVRTGEIEHLRIGRRVLISRPALAKFIEANSRTSFSG
jgi:excisionase family DNA binding protein